MRARGFTLLELLVSLAIFAAIGVMAYSGLGNVMRQQAQTDAYAARLQEVEMAYRLLARDFEQFTARDIRDAFGDRQPALLAPGGLSGVEFTRAGYPNPAGYPRSELQRVGYRVDDGRLVRRSWRVLDRSQDSLPDELVLADRVEALVLRYLDVRNKWQDSWPPPQVLSPTGEPSRPEWPLAVEVRLALEDLGELRWLFRLPEPWEPTAPAVPGNGNGGQNEDNGGGNNTNGGQT